MALFENFPYTNFHDLNLDWIIKSLEDLKKEWADFEVLNSIIIADPAEWDPERVYRKNTIVVDEEGNGYISKQDTIPGTLLTDTDYWQLVFPYGISIDEFKTYVLHLIDEQDTLIANRMNAQDQYIENNTMKNINARYFLFCGDSYVVQNSNKMFTAFCSAADVPSGHAFNVAVSGASFSNSSNSFLMQLQNFTGDKEQITDIIITGGINDATLDMPTDFDALRGYIGAWKTYARQNYPNAELHLYYCGSCLPLSSYYGTHGAVAQEWVRYAWYKSGNDCDYQAIPFLNTFASNFASDAIHPTEGAQIEIAARIAQLINYEKPSYDVPSYDLVIKGSGATSTEAGSNIITGKMRVYGDVVTLNIDTLSCHIAQDTVFGRLHKVEIGYMQYAEVKRAVNIPVMLFFNAWSPSSPNFVHAYLTLENGRAYVTLREISGGAWVELTAASNSTITITAPVTVTTELTNIN